MAKTTRQKRRQRTSKAVPIEMPPGVRLIRTLEGHDGWILSLAVAPHGKLLASATLQGAVKLWDVKSGTTVKIADKADITPSRVAFDPQGEMLAIAIRDGSIELWDPEGNTLLRTIQNKGDAKEGNLCCLAFSPQASVLACGAKSTISLWDTQTAQLIKELAGHSDLVRSVAYHPDGEMLASGSDDGTIKLWDVHAGKLLRTLNHEGFCLGVTFAPTGRLLASAGTGRLIRLLDPQSGKLIRTLEGHTEFIDALSFSPNGRLIASRSADGTVRLWNCDSWETAAVLHLGKSRQFWSPALTFHPTLPLLATAGSALSTNSAKAYSQIQLFELDFDVLLGARVSAKAAASTVHHTTCKIVLLGDHSVGKSGLGYRMITGAFKEQASTHGQRFWVFPALGKHRKDGTECEAILWDFAGQPDYRLVHALFVDNADLALVLFDSSDIRDPLHGVDFWLKQLQTQQGRCPIILVAAQTDRGVSSLTADELQSFCKRHGILGPIATSAATGLGINELVEQMKQLIPWDDKSSTVTTTTFKRIKDYVLGLKEMESQDQTIVTADELRERLQKTDSKWRFTDAEMITSISHLENYGYVRRLLTSKGELRILLLPERLNNLASSFVLEARRNPKGLGALEEKRLLSGGYDFPEFMDLDPPEREVLLDSAALLFLEHNVCFRETDPLRMEPYLVFPELINLKKPAEEDTASQEGAAYTVNGPTENVFASLVVLLGYTHTFTRTAQWQNNARYEVGGDLICGFRQEAERDGELDLVLCFGAEVGPSVRTLFQGLFESFLSRRNLTVKRYEPVRCTNVDCNHLLDRAVVRQRLKEGKNFTFCNDCGQKLILPPSAEPIQLSREVQSEVQSQRRAAEQRTRFEQAVFRIRTYAAEQSITPPECFISYAWGEPERERWIEKRLATDLQKAGIDVLLDRWHNAQIGASVARFVERIEECDQLIVVGTPLYKQKAKNIASPKGSVVAAEYELAGIRLLASEEKKKTVLPVLLAGDESESFPALLRGRVYADFRNEEEYFVTAFDLILSIYKLSSNHPAVADLRDSLTHEVFGWDR